MKKYFTLMIIPKNASGVKKFKLRSVFFCIGSLIVFCIIFSLTFVFYDYYRLRSKHINLDDYQEIHSQNQLMIDSYQQQFAQINSKILFLNKTATKLKSLLNNTDEDKTKLTKDEERLLAENSDEKQLLNLIRSTDILQASFDRASNKELDNVIQFMEDPTNIYDAIPRDWPVKGFLFFSFKQKSNPYAKNYFNEGIVIGAKVNALVKAPSSGVVTSIVQDKNSNYIIEVMHSRKLVSRYSSISKSLVMIGDRIDYGDPIGTAGVTDTILAPHLYYQILFDGIAQNPINYIQE